MNTITVDSAAQAPVEQPQLSLNDVQNLLLIIDLASQRGAFRGPELGQVGPVFDRVSQYLQAVAPPQPQTVGQSEPVPTPVPTPAPVSVAPPFTKLGTN